MLLRISGYMTMVAIVAKLGLYLIDLSQQTMAVATMFINLLILLVGSFFAVRYYKSENPNAGFKAEIKAGMRVTSMFALFLSIFIWVYYKYIDTHYFPNMIEERVRLAAENPEIDLEQVRKMGEMLFSPQTHASITLFGLIAAGAIYSAVLVFMLRKIYQPKPNG